MYLLVLAVTSYVVFHKTDREIQRAPQKKKVVCHILLYFGLRISTIFICLFFIVLLLLEGLSKLYSLKGLCSVVKPDYYFWLGRYGLKLSFRRLIVM